MLSTHFDIKSVGFRFGGNRRKNQTKKRRKTKMLIKFIFGWYDDDGYNTDI